LVRRGTSRGLIRRYLTFCILPPFAAYRIYCSPNGRATLGLICRHGIHVKKFANLTGKGDACRVISTEKEDSRIYLNFADDLMSRYPESRPEALSELAEPCGIHHEWAFAGQLLDRGFGCGFYGLFLKDHKRADDPLTTLMPVHCQHAGHDSIAIIEQMNQGGGDVHAYQSEKYPFSCLVQAINRLDCLSISRC